MFSFFDVETSHTCVREAGVEDIIMPFYKCSSKKTLAGICPDFAQKQESIYLHYNKITEA